MHIIRRVGIFAVLGMLVVSLHGGMRILGSVADRGVRTAADPLTLAVRTAQLRATDVSLNVQERRRRETLRVREEALQSIAREKRTLRLEQNRVRSVLAGIERRYGIDASDIRELSAVLLRDEERIDSILDRFAEGAPPSHAMLALFRSLLLGPVADMNERAVLESVLNASRENAVELLRDVRQLPATDIALQDRHQALQQEYVSVQSEYFDIERQLHASAGGSEENEQIIAEVHDQIFRLQDELGRIDARLRRRAERALIEKGLRSPREGEYSDKGYSGEPDTLGWPVASRVISAGYMEPSYKRFFGVQHYGLDIATPQGTPIQSAAEGVVFVVREGGAKGYTYVLIGHRSGMATLYGHLSQTNVVDGQEVEKGQLIGLSGGAPGTRGAGPMTTGSHLHFEVIQDGAHLDPFAALSQ